MSANDPLNKPVIIFDGVCVLCSRLLKLVLFADRNTQKFNFATAQSDYGQVQLKERGYSTDTFETVLLVTPENKLFTKIDVVIEVSKSLGGFWHILRVLKILPKSWRNSLYDFIATRRYKWFGKSDYCQLIPKHYSDRIIK